MAKRGYKLQEFVAHSGNVNCLRIGRKHFRHFLTGGDDNKVNLWSTGKPTCSTSLSGHSSPVESVAFDSAEVLVLAGSSSGAIKLWDLEEAKMVRSLSGHRSYCTALEFHPFGEFFASGSMDTNLKIWDIRKKGCIHTYKGHTRGISTIRFSPDGRWVVSGGFDNIIKVWDLTAGKLLHDFKFHEGHVRSIEFHPMEFLLATGSADRTVKFWDLETFEMIGSTRRETAGVRAVTFHPDGKTLFGGLDDGLKVYAWEPVVCHDSVDMGWSTLGDLCIHDGKLLGCTYFENSVGVWAADVSQIAPYGTSVVAERNGSAKISMDSGESPLERVGTQKWHSLVSDDDSNNIKNIYVDTAGANCVTSKKGSITSPESVYLETKEMTDLHNQKKGSFLGSGTNASGQNNNQSVVAPSIVPPDISDANELIGTRRETFPSGRAGMAMPLKPSHFRKQSTGKFDMKSMAIGLESNVPEDEKAVVPKVEAPIFSSKRAVDGNSKETRSDIKDVYKKSEKTTLVSHSLHQENTNVAAKSRMGVTAVKIVNGVAVVRGRTRSLVERFEKRENLSGDEVHTVTTTDTVCQSPKKSTKHPPDMATHKGILEPKTSPMLTPTTATEPKTSPMLTPDTATEPLIKETKESPSHTSDTMIPTQERKPLPIDMPNTATEPLNKETKTSAVHKFETMIPKQAEEPKTSPFHTYDTTIQTVIQEPKQFNSPAPSTSTPVVTHQPKLSDSEERIAHLPSSDSETSPRQTINSSARVSIQAQRTARLRLPSASAPAVSRTPKSSPARTQKTNSAVVNRGSKFSSSRTPYLSTTITRAPRTPPLENSDQLAVERQEPKTNVSNIVELLMDSHDGVLNTLRSRLTKLQVIRHFWERNDVNGAINAARKLPDYSVQADIVSILVDRMDIITLDRFSSLLPVLVGLLDSDVERHAVVSLEMLLKLVAGFGSVVYATVSAPRTIGVDLHAEERLECCKECVAHLQNIKKVLPAVIRRGGVVAKSALELNLVLQDS